MRESLQPQLKRLEESQYFLRTQIENALKSYVINKDQSWLHGHYNTYYDLWTATFSDRFYDMMTASRIGTVIESNLRTYYMERRGITSSGQLLEDDGYKFCKKGLFQRVQGWQQNGVITLYRKYIDYDLTENINLQNVQVAMLDRHLYSHNSGLIDDAYIEGIKKVTGINLLADPMIGDYPNEEVYWLGPLKHLNEMIWSTRCFFEAFP